MSDRPPASFASAVGSRAEITIRHALSTDGAALQRLAELAGRRLSPGPVLVVEADAEILAAADASGGVISDPFRVTVDIVELLRLRAGQLRAVAA